MRAGQRSTYDARPMSSPNSIKVVFAALAGNLLIAISKFVAAFMTGSAATLAEAVHSVADSGNQVLLLLGIRLSDRGATQRHPFGRSVERYFWPFVVSIMLFTVGGAFAIYEGVHKLSELGHGEAPHGGSNLWNYGVLGLSFLFEAYSFSVAFGEFRKLKGDSTLYRTIVDAKDPTIPIVVLEDTAALVGLAIALLGVGLSDLTGWAGCDGIASLVIGALLCGVAYLLGQETHSLLVGESAPPKDRQAVLDLAKAVPGIRGVPQLLSLYRGPDDVLLALKLDFERGLSIEQVEEAIDLFEAKVRERLPQMKYIFCEPDSRYQGPAEVKPRDW